MCCSGALQYIICLFHWTSFQRVDYAARSTAKCACGISRRGAAPALRSRTIKAPASCLRSFGEAAYSRAIIVNLCFIPNSHLRSLCNLAVSANIALTHSLIFLFQSRPRRPCQDVGRRAFVYQWQRSRCTAQRGVGVGNSRCSRCAATATPDRSAQDRFVLVLSIFRTLQHVYTAICDFTVNGACVANCRCICGLVVVARCGASQREIR